MSSWERPTAEKEFVSCSTLKVGSGRAATASAAMDTNPSYLPAGTDQVAPPACKKQKCTESGHGGTLISAPPIEDSKVCLKTCRSEVLEESSSSLRIYLTTTKCMKSAKFATATLTWTVLSRAANARMSAHETIPGHAASTASLMASTTSNPRKLKLGCAVFSESGPSRSTEPSQPCTCKNRAAAGASHKQSST